MAGRIQWQQLEPGTFDAERVFGLLGFPLTAAASGLGIVVGSWLRPAGCRFLEFTGWPCPTCGSTRALLLLFAGRFEDAFKTQPLAVTLGLAYALFAVYACVVVVGGLPRLRLRLRRRWWLVLLLFLLSANWGYLLFQHARP